MRTQGKGRLCHRGRGTQFTQNTNMRRQHASCLQERTLRFSFRCTRRNATGRTVGKSCRCLSSPATYSYEPTLFANLRFCKRLECSGWLKAEAARARSQTQRLRQFEGLHKVQ